MILCEYGCNQEAKYQFKNGKWCCSKNPNSCPEVNKKRGNSLKGENNPNFGKKRPWLAELNRQKDMKGDKNPMFNKKKPNVFVTMKKCSKCKEIKNRSEFHNHKSHRDGLSSQCKLCANGKPERHKAWHLKSNYGISLEDYNKILEEQHGACAICGNSPKAYLCVDHDHITGGIRGLLCFHCNVILGHAQDNIETLQKAIEYLRVKRMER